MLGSKTSALPLGYTPTIPHKSEKLVSPQGFEPRTHGLEGRCSIQLSYEPTQVEKMERMMRIELTPSAWKAEVLPLNYIRIKWSGRRDSNSRPSPWQGDALPLSHFRTLVEGDGFEPSKAQLTDLQSAPFGHSGIPRSLLWSWRRESNPQPADYKSAALPLSHASMLFGGRYRARTCDPLLVRQVLSQLS